MLDANIITRMARPAMLCLLSATLLTGCANTLDRLASINKTPEMTQTANPQLHPDYKPMSWPLPEPVPSADNYANSLWQPGARTFFRDQRAARTGDILTVRIEINDRAELENESEAIRNTVDNIGAANVFGFEALFDSASPGDVDPENLFSINGRTQNIGQGSVEREERIETEIAAVITQVLPNGNFVIHGSQEVRVNDEVREIVVSGIIRPEDIDSTNRISSEQIAEARIAYGGRGQLSNIQRPRWGMQVIDILSPF